MGVDDEMLMILREMRDRQKESLELQRDQFAFIKTQYDRAEAIQEKAEKLQDRAGGIIKYIMLLAIAAGVLLLVMLGTNL